MSRDAAALSLKSNRTLRFGGNFTALIVSRIHLEKGSLRRELGCVVVEHLLSLLIWLLKQAFNEQSPFKMMGL